MANEPSFVDIFALTKITPGMVTDKFGPALNSSFFDASNILGGLKIKGLADFSASLSDNEIIITETGKQLLAEADQHASDPFDKIDDAILKILVSNKHSIDEISSSMNLMQRDLAMHLYKLIKQGYISAEFRNGILEIILTEKGFMQAQPASVPLASSNTQKEDAASNAPTQEEVNALASMHYKGNSSKPVIIGIAVAAILIISILIFLFIG
ncbi:MAG: hypothetical protein QXY10_01460 [Candidatus Micrarchaeaceae archaeon]